MGNLSKEVMVYSLCRLMNYRRMLFLCMYCLFTDELKIPYQILISININGLKTQ